MPRNPERPVALIVALIVFVACAAYMMPFLPDDSFISFRYAEHLADGAGLTFNAGADPVEAYSNLLWILICAALYKVGLSLPAVTPYVGLFLGFACICLLWGLIRRRAPHWTQQMLPLLFFAASGPFVMYAISGMETALFALCLLAMARFVDDYLETPRARALAALTLVGLAASLARPEGVLALPVCLGMLAWEQRRAAASRAGLRPLALALTAFAILTVAYHAWRVSYFHDWLPTPFYSKGAEGENLFTGWYRNLNRYFVNWAYYSPPQGYFVLGLLALGFARLRALGEHAPRLSADRVIFALALVFSAVYANFVDWMPGMRYHVAILGVLIVPIAGLHAILPESAWTNAGRHRVRFAAFCLMVFIASAINLSNLKTVAVKMDESARLCMTPLADWLGQAVPDTSLLAMGDVGLVPYYTKLATLDIHPQSLTDRHIAKGAFSAEYALSRKPDVIALSVRGVHSARMDPLHYALYGLDEFNAQYHFVGTVRHQWYEDRAYWIFLNERTPVRRDIVTQPPEGIGKQHRTGLKE